MKTFLLQIERTPEGLRCRWYGESAHRPAGELTLAPAPTADELGMLPAFGIDLAPLMAAVADGRLADAAALAAAVDLGPLRELLPPAGLLALAEALFPFLWGSGPGLRTFALSQGEAGLPGREHAPPGADPDHRLVRVWFATHRAPLADGGFSDGGDGEAMSYGWCAVFIPKSHKPGSTGTWWRRWIWLAEDDTLELRHTRTLPRERFWAALSGKLAADWGAGERNLFVFIHGYNVSFDEAAIQAAQLGYDLKLPGEMAFYSWPSRGGLKDYPADEATIGASVNQLARFLDELGEKAGAERIHLFVHSMGNRGFLSALERLAALRKPSPRLGQVFFCAPDEDTRTFLDKSSLFPFACENRSLLVSPDDKAVATSEWLHRADRVGIVPPVPRFDGIETIQVTGFGMLSLGHGYFASAERVILDMREAINTRKPASQRQIPKDQGGFYLIDVGQRP